VHEVQFVCEVHAPQFVSYLHPLPYICTLGRVLNTVFREYLREFNSVGVNFDINT